jgi:hypothetical protein
VLRKKAIVARLRVGGAVGDIALGVRWCDGRRMCV